MITGKAENGLMYAVRKSGSSVGYCALSIRCGTRDEAGFHSGIAHFTEHTIFKGTGHRSAAVINSCLDRYGGELNAYTTKEEIVFHATVLKEDLSKAASLLFELATEATFPEKEIATEKGVVIDEIQSYKDSPADDVYDRFEEALFAGHPLGGSILGTPASVRKITSDELRRFVRENFTPDRMVFTVVADFDERRMEKALLKLVSRHFPSGSVATSPAGVSPLKTSASQTPPLRSACGSPSRPRVALFSEDVPVTAVSEVPALLRSVLPGTGEVATEPEGKWRETSFRRAFSICLSSKSATTVKAIRSGVKFSFTNLLSSSEVILRTEAGVPRMEPPRGCPAKSASSKRS